LKSSRRFFTRLAAGAIVLSVIASCGGGGSSSTDDTNPDGTPVDTTSSAGPVFPLLGTPVTDAAAASRVALVAKIDNHPNARPQTGLNKADIVFEENVESLVLKTSTFLVHITSHCLRGVAVTIA
jgi:hypothetical protein